MIDPMSNFYKATNLVLDTFTGTLETEMAYLRLSDYLKKADGEKQFSKF